MLERYLRTRIGIEKKEHGGESVSFLDLKINIEGRMFDTSLFDKRDDFPFDIVRMPYKSSNIPSKIFYSSLGAEILRIGRATMSTTAFVSSSRALIHRMMNQGAAREDVTRLLKKIYGQYGLFRKFASSAAKFATSLQ